MFPDHINMARSFHICRLAIIFFFFFKQKTAYDILRSDWSSDVCSSDLASDALAAVAAGLADAINAGSLFQAEYTQATVELTGSTNKGDVWTLVLNGTVADSYEVQSGEGLADVVTGLTGSYDGVTVAGSGLELSLSASAGFTVEVLVSGANVQGGADISGSTGGAYLVVAARENVLTEGSDAVPFTAEVLRLESASDVNPPQVGGSVDTTDTVNTIPWTDFWAQYVLVLDDESAAIVSGTTWTVRMGSDLDATQPEVREAAAYDYRAGANRDITRPQPMDVRIVDNDAVGVLVIETNGGTQLVEPTEEVFLGSGFLSQSAFARIDLNALATDQFNTGWDWTLRLYSNGVETVVEVNGGSRTAVAQALATAIG